MSHVLDLPDVQPLDAPFAVSSDVLECGRVLVVVEGDLDMSTAPVLERELDAVFQGGSVCVLILDLSAVAFMSSAGIQLLMTTHVQAELASADFVVVSATRGVLRPLELTGLASSFVISDSRSGALADCCSPPCLIGRKPLRSLGAG